MKKDKRKYLKLCIWVVIFQIPCALFAQVDPALESLRNIVPPSPNASSLGKYSEWPVSLYTGLPNISVPIYELNGRNIKVPIDISYHASGNRVGDIASWVGLGWALNAGGVISRSVRGLPDEDSYFSYASRYTDPNNFQSTSTITNGATMHRVDAANLNGDSQQDVYTLSAMGKSYRLLLKADGTVTTMPYSNVRVTYAIPNSWRVTLEDGTQLLFGGSNSFCEINTTTFGAAAGGIQYNSSWYLQSITSPSGEVVNFTYSGTTITQDTHVTESDAIQYKTGDNGNVCSILTNFSLSSKADYQFVTQLSLTRIESDLTRIEFVPQTSSRSDLKDGTALSEIKIFSKQANKYIDDYLFNYTYSQAVNSVEYNGNPADSSYFHKRLRLLSLKRQAPGNTTFQLWSFQYNPQNLPSRRSFAQDHLGFFNGAVQNSTLLPPVVFTLPQSTFWTSSTQYQTGFTPSTNHLLGASKVFNGNYMQAEMLTQITYPTGGYTKFNYEPNSLTTNTEQFSTTSIPGQLYITYNQTPFVNSKSTSFTITKPQYVQIVLASSISSGILADFPSARVYAQVLNSSGTVLGSLTTSGNTYFTLLTAGTYTFKIYTNVASDEFTSANDNVNINASLTYSKSLGSLPFTQMVGGLRVKSIINYDGVNATPINDRYFTYENGFVINPIDSLNDYVTTQNSNTTNTSTGENCLFTKVIRNSSTKFALGSIQGGAIGYGKVTTTYGPTGGNGKTISYFSNVADNGTVNAKNYPYPPTDPREWRRGLLLAQSDYNVTQKVKQLYNSYSFIFKTQVINFAAGYATVFTPLCTQLVANDCGLIAPPFNISSEQVLHDSSTETIYNTTGPDSVTTVTNYYYDNAANCQPTRMVQVNSKRDTLKTYNRTALEKATINSSIPLTAAASVAIDTMLARNMVGIYLETEKYKNQSLTGKLLVNYNLFSNHVLQKEVLSQDGINAIQSRMMINGYDVYGNILQQQKTGGPSISYKWGYNSQYPIAECKNAASTEFYYEGYEESTATGVITGTSHTGLKYTTNAAVSWTRPNTRNYVISYWYRSGGIWMYKPEQAYTGSSFTLTVAGADAAYDDVRIYPADAQMTTYTYDPLIGATSATDAKGQTAYYEYDGFQRLINIKDKDGNIVKHTDYHYQGQ